jgi:hypothetical protein
VQSDKRGHESWPSPVAFTLAATSAAFWGEKKEPEALEAAEYQPRPTPVTVPDGVGPGGVIAVERSDGQIVQVRVPSNAYPGETFYATI